MQAISPRSQTNNGLGRRLGYFLIPPVVTLALVVLLLGTAMSLYRADHSGRIYTGVMVQGVDIGGMTLEEAAAALRDTSAYSSAGEWVDLQGEVAAITRHAEAASDPEEDEDGDGDDVLDEEVLDQVDADDTDGSDEGDPDTDGSDESDAPDADEDETETDLTPVERLREEIRALREHLRDYV